MFVDLDFKKPVLYLLPVQYASTFINEYCVFFCVSVMEGSLPQALRHILSNARFYGSETFLLAAELLASFINQEPSLLSTLQDSRLTDVLMHALLLHDVRLDLRFPKRMALRYCSYSFDSVN